jgi:hypothetical protein
LSKDLVKSDPEKLPSTSSVLGQTLQGLAEGITGLAASDRRDFVRSVGFVLQRLRGGSFLSSLLAEWNRYREEGRVKEDYEKTEQHLDCLQEMLDFLDKDLPDNTRFETLQKILLVAATEAHSTRESVLPQQYMKLVRELSSGEILVLLTTHRCAQDIDDRQTNSSARTWLEKIANASGLRHPELVANHESKLIAKNLITKRTNNDGSGVFRGAHGRLTELGHGLCEFIALYSND